MREQDLFGSIDEEIWVKPTKYSELRIRVVLRPAEGGVPVAELCRGHGRSNASFDKWRTKSGGMDASMISQRKATEDENRRMMTMFAKLRMQNQRLKAAAGRKQIGHLNAARWPRPRWQGTGSARRVIAIPPSQAAKRRNPLIFWLG